MSKSKKWSAARLASALLIGASLTLGYAFLIDQANLVYRNYLCWRHAVSSTSCLRNAPYDFVRDIEGVRYEGNTGNFVDANVLHFGAYEKNVLFFLRDAMRSVTPVQAFSSTSAPIPGSIRSLCHRMLLKCTLSNRGSRLSRDFGIWSQSTAQIIS